MIISMSGSVMTGSTSSPDSTKTVAELRLLFEQAPGSVRPPSPPPNDLTRGRLSFAVHSPISMSGSAMTGSTSSPNSTKTVSELRLLFEQAPGSVRPPSPPPNDLSRGRLSFAVLMDLIDSLDWPTACFNRLAEMKNFFPLLSTIVEEHQ
ncbi:hypothetical protein QR680_000679 [Steinernema hermaphroditum]|uniref:Uncharacterized protein n=1 Tax=Steinernema hermaphroditum TaxID=289476 RepID=A0AA39GWZ8_9BILA|nr:hypothetical protein QR680_000679 [Steinernema hermaphroditum]